MSSIRSWSATFRDTSTDERERLAIRLTEAASGFDERVLVHTCHRAELFGVARDGVLPERPDGVGQWIGREAVERLFVVASGLDSAVVAEEQVLGQVRSAYEGALARGETGPMLNELFRRAIRFGKHVRATTTPVGRDRSLVDRAIRWLAERTPIDSRSVLLIGTGRVAQDLGRQLATRGAIVTVASRSSARAAELVDHLPGTARHRALTLDDAVATVAEADVVGLATGPKSDLEEVRRAIAARVEAGTAPLVVDLMAPSATGALRDQLGKRLCDLEFLGVPVEDGLAPRERQRVEREMKDEIERAVSWIAGRSAGDAVRLLRDHAGAVRRRHLDGLRGTLDERQMARVEAASAAMVAELLHVPTQQLRRDPDAASRIRSLFGIDR